MASRRSTGGVLAPSGQRRSWAIRFRANGKRHCISLGRPEEGWNRKRAEEELENVLADVRRGIWVPPRRAKQAEEPQAEPTFHQFASEWLERRSHELSPKTKTDYGWRLSHHLLPHFADYLLSEITIEAVDQFRQAKVREARALSAQREELARIPRENRGPLPRPLSNSSVNKLIRLLSAVLADAEEMGTSTEIPRRGGGGS